MLPWIEKQPLKEKNNIDLQLERAFSVRSHLSLAIPFEF